MARGINKVILLGTCGTQHCGPLRAQPSVLANDGKDAGRRFWPKNCANVL